jgi:hypothetical protein
VCCRWAAKPHQQQQQEVMGVAQQAAAALPLLLPRAGLPLAICTVQLLAWQVQQQQQVAVLGLCHSSSSSSSLGAVRGVLGLQAAPS